ncbi:MAG: hypothetical protein KGJ34_01350 [Patescibacteria group bacterium]|nr:hypothetical protein [Patescibacteria group bacterium]
MESSQENLPQEGKIDIDAFKRAEIRVGEIRSAEKIENADKLLRLRVYFGGSEERQIVSGISAYFPDPQALVGRRVAFAYNLKPRTIRGLESDGMILAASGEDGTFALLEATGASPGARVR